MYHPLYLMTVPRQAKLNRHWGTLMDPSTVHVVEGRRKWQNVACALETRYALQTYESSACRKPAKSRRKGRAQARCGHLSVNSTSFKPASTSTSANNATLTHRGTHTSIPRPSTRSQYRRKINPNTVACFYLDAHAYDKGQDAFTVQ